MPDELYCRMCHADLITGVTSILWFLGSTGSSTPRVAGLLVEWRGVDAGSLIYRVWKVGCRCCFLYCFLSFYTFTSRSPVSLSPAPQAVCNPTCNLQPASYPIRLDIACLTNHKLVGEVSHCNGSSVLQACGWCPGAYRKYMYAAGSARARR